MGVHWLFYFFMTFPLGTGVESYGGRTMSGDAAAAEEIQRKLHVLDEARTMMASTGNTMSDNDYNVAKIAILSQESD